MGQNEEGERATIESVLLRACKRAVIRKKRVEGRMSVDRETSERETNVSAVRRRRRWGEERERERPGSRVGEEIGRVSARVRERTHVWNTPKSARSDCTCPSSGKETGNTKNGSERLARCSSVLGAVASAVLRPATVHRAESRDNHSPSQLFHQMSVITSCRKIRSR